MRQNYYAGLPFLAERTILLQLVEKDQTLRGLLGEFDFKKVDSLIHENDVSNMRKINAMIKKIGFPDQSKVGTDGADAVFILLMHTLNNGVDQKQNSAVILPMIEEAVKNGKFMSFNYAILVDRQRALQNEKQVFGTYWENREGKRVITPIENVELVDQRRREIGLPSLDYVCKLQGLLVPDGYKYNSL